MIAFCDAARDLKIGQAVAHAVPPDRLIDVATKRHPRRGHPLPQFLQRPLQPRPVPFGIQRATVAHGEHFVDRVRELQSPVLDMNSGFGERHIAAVDIGDARHGLP